MRAEECKHCIYKEEPALCPDDCEIKYGILKSLGEVR